MPGLGYPRAEHPLRVKNPDGTWYVISRLRLRPCADACGRMTSTVYCKSCATVRQHRRRKGVAP